MPATEGDFFFVSVIHPENLVCVILNVEVIRFRNALFLGIWAGGLVMIHTHSFFALGLTSIGWTIWCAVRGKGSFLQRILPWAVYGGTALLLALPQLLVWTFGQVGGSDHFLSFHFNWVNNSGSAGLRDGYLWFYIKNIGLPFVLILLSLLEKNSKRRFLAAGAFTIFVTAELIQFQPNEYDNNKLFYVWYMFGAMLAAAAAGLLYRRYRKVLPAVICWVLGEASRRLGWIKPGDLKLD